MNDIKIAKKTLDEINDHAIREYPKECCGWIIQNADKSLYYEAAENLQDKYHKLDPETYPRSAEIAFLMDTLKLNRAMEKAHTEGGQLFSIVHSHIDCDAYFSKEDEEQMSNQDQSGPVFPAMCYLVVSIRQKKPAGNAVFVYDQEKKKYQQVNLSIT